MQRRGDGWVRRLPRVFRAAPDCAGATLRHDLDEALRRLRAVGIRQVAWVDLTQPAFGIPVARVIIPGLEGPWTPPEGEYTPGARAARGMSDGGVPGADTSPTRRRSGVAGHLSAAGPAGGRLSRGARRARRARSASSMAASSTWPRCGIARSYGRCRRVFTCSARPAWAPCAPPNWTGSACVASAGSMPRIATGTGQATTNHSRTMTKSR